MPLNRIAQFEALTGSRFISEYLSVLHGDRVVIEIPRGRKGKTADMAQVQSQTAAALALLAKWHARIAPHERPAAHGGAGQAVCRAGFAADFGCLPRRLHQCGRLFGTARLAAAVY